MDPVLLAQATLNGLMLGGVYSLMAVGLSLI
ncbi:MAG: branched-chain amino acid ABC transporter permease, partial [candidate division NC10 bacterium]|nr:branched-chain amino acid ABC transporter permease [candidate division NC10 bacterium]